ncbi:MAG: phosphate/phosphite/phosphonate ABC transporter substrate-binding protein [Hyphomicrobiaceae bacterium]
MTGHDPIAVLPMYDWQHVRCQTDQFWVALRQNLIKSGVSAPHGLSRPANLLAAWRSRQLVLGQTCGLPYVDHLRDHVQLIGTPDYGVPGCRSGWYRSAVVVRSNDERETLPDFRHSILAVNSRSSQSGWRAILSALARERVDWPCFASVIRSGSHARSIELVASGQADLAAVDFVSWRMAKKHLVASGRVRILDLTDPMPGLPLIAHRAACRATLCEAVEQAIEELPEHVRRAIGICGFWRSTPADYDIIARQPWITAKRAIGINR